MSAGQGQLQALAKRLRESKTDPEAVNRGRDHLEDEDIASDDDVRNVVAGATKAFREALNKPKGN